MFNVSEKEPRVMTHKMIREYKQKIYESGYNKLDELGLLFDYIKCILCLQRIFISSEYICCQPYQKYSMGYVKNEIGSSLVLCLYNTLLRTENHYMQYVLMCLDMLTNMSCHWPCVKCHVLP